MRDLAASLRAAADSIASADDAVWRQATSVEFEGPAARRLADVTRGWHGDLGGAAAALSDTADFLLRAAAQLEEQLAQLRRQAEAGPGFVA
jgi:uncharacterized protein YukE